MSEPSDAELPFKLFEDANYLEQAGPSASALELRIIARRIRLAAQRLESRPSTSGQEISEAIEALKALDAVLDFSTPMKAPAHVLIEIDDPSAFNLAADKARAALQAAQKDKS